MNYARFYQKISQGFRPYQKLLNALNTGLTAIMYLAYLLILIYVALYQRDQLFKTIFIPAISFLILTEMRKVINRKRPYEQWSIDPLIKKDTKGLSFPSRHVFSAAIIAMTALYFNLAIGLLLLGVTFLIACIRVIGGIHFPSDVAFGYFQGIVFGLLFYWL